MNTHTKILLILLLIAVPVLVYYNTGLDNKTGSSPATVPKADQDNNPPECKPAFADGGGPYYRPNSPFRNIIHPAGYTGNRLKMSGKVLRNDCTTPVSRATLDIWQADDTGEYVDDWYRGQIQTDTQGNYSFETVVPKGYGEGTGYRPPHIHFKVFSEGKEVITSQMFFPETSGTPGFDDAYIMSVDTREENGETVHYGKHNIILP